MTLLNHRQSCGSDEEEKRWKRVAVRVVCFLENAISVCIMRKILANFTPRKERDDEAKLINSWIITIPNYMFSVFETSTKTLGICFSREDNSTWTAAEVRQFAGLFFDLDPLLHASAMYVYPARRFDMVGIYTVEDHDTDEEQRRANYRAFIRCRFLDLDRCLEIRFQSVQKGRE
jgi:hypothetical protein